MSSQRIWVVTGSSQGLGRELVLAALARGDKVVATARKSETLQDLVELYPERCRALQLDVTEPYESLAHKAKQAVDIWGNIDVVVNNAGYALVGVVEEAGAAGFEELYKTNVFGAVNVTNAFLPHMRERHAGTIIFVGSRSGWRPKFPEAALYSSSKAAIHAIADAMSIDLAPLNIKVLNVVPGGLRTNNMNNGRHLSNDNLPNPAPNVPFGTVPEYAATHAKMQEFINAHNGRQPGDPEKAASAIVDVVRGEGTAQGRAWPQALFLGSDVFNDVSTVCENTLKTLEEWGDVIKGIDL